MTEKANWTLLCHLFSVSPHENVTKRAKYIVEWKRGNEMIAARANSCNRKQLKSH